MANPEHIEMLRKGVKKWNQWREKNPRIRPDLAGTDFGRRKLLGVNFSNAILTEAKFRGANLRMADFTLADLSGADFNNARLIGADFNCAKLTNSSWKRTLIGVTIFVCNDLSRVNCLDEVRHFCPSSIGIDTLYMSRGKISEKFLCDAGVPEELVSYLPSLLAASQLIQWHSCFISYSTKDEEFAQRLHVRMRQAGLRVWFAPEDMKGGDYFFEQIERAIQLHDRLLLVLSEDSIQSKWVEREIRKTRKIERAEKRRKLFPITLTDYATLKKWECLDSDTGEDLAEEVRKYHIPDFSNWKNPAAFARAFARLEKDLRTSIK